MSTKMQRQRRSLTLAAGRSVSPLELLGSEGDPAEGDATVDSPAGGGQGALGSQEALGSQTAQGSQQAGGSQGVSSSQDVNRFRRGRTTMKIASGPHHKWNMDDISPIPRLVRATDTHPPPTKSTNDESIPSHQNLDVPEFSGFSSSPTGSIVFSDSAMEHADFAEPPHLDREPGYPDKDPGNHGNTPANEDDIPPLQRESLSGQGSGKDQGQKKDTNVRTSALEFLAQMYTKSAVSENGKRLKGTETVGNFRKNRVDPLHSLIQQCVPKAKCMENSTSNRGVSTVGGREGHDTESPPQAILIQDEDTLSSGNADRNDQQRDQTIDFLGEISESEEEEEEEGGDPQELQAELLSQIASTDEDIEDKLDTSHTSLPQVSPPDGASSRGSSDYNVALGSTRTRNLTRQIPQTELPCMELSPGAEIESHRTSLKEVLRSRTQSEEPLELLPTPGQRKASAREEVESLIRSKGGGGQSQSLNLEEPHHAAREIGNRTVSEVQTSAWGDTGSTLGVSGSRRSTSISQEERTGSEPDDNVVDSDSDSVRSKSKATQQVTSESMKRRTRLSLSLKSGVSIPEVAEISPVPSDLDTEMKSLIGSLNQQPGVSHRTLRRSSTTSSRRSSVESNPSSRHSEADSTSQNPVVSKQTKRKSHQGSQATSTGMDPLFVETNQKTSGYQPEVEPISPASIRSLSQAGSQSSLGRRLSTEAQSNLRYRGPLEGDEPPNPADLITNFIPDVMDSMEEEQETEAEGEEGEEIRAGGKVKPMAVGEQEDEKGEKGMSEGEPEEEKVDGEQEEEEEEEEEIGGEEEEAGAEEHMDMQEDKEEEVEIRREGVMGEEEGEQEETEEEGEGKGNDIREDEQEELVEAGVNKPEEEENSEGDDEQCLVPETQEPGPPRGAELATEVSLAVIPDTQPGQQSNALISDDESPAEGDGQAPGNVTDKAEGSENNNNPAIIHSSIVVEMAGSEQTPEKPNEGPTEDVHNMEEPLPTESIQVEPQDVEPEERGTVTEKEPVQQRSTESSKSTRRRSPRLKKGKGKSPKGVKRKIMSNTDKQNESVTDDEQQLEVPRTRLRLSTPTTVPVSTPLAPKSGPSHYPRARLADLNSQAAKKPGRRKEKQRSGGPEESSYTVAGPVPGPSTASQPGPSTARGALSKPSQPKGESKLITVWQGEEGVRRGPRDVHGLDVLLNSFEEVAWEFRDSVEDPICKKAVGILATKTQREMRIQIEKAAKVKRLETTANRAERALRKSRRDLLLMQKARSLLRHEIYDYEEEQEEIERIKKVGELDQWVSDLSDLHKRFRKSSRSPHKKLTDKDYVVFS